MLPFEPALPFPDETLWRLIERRAAETPAAQMVVDERGQSLTFAEYRAAFRPGRIAEPYVIVSVDAVVADTDAAARRLAAGYGRWVHSIRAGTGPYSVRWRNIRFRETK